MTVLENTAWAETSYNPEWLWLTYVREGWIYVIQEIAGHATDDKGRAERVQAWAKEHDVFLKWKEV